jgi:uncharacterized protein YukE
MTAPSNYDDSGMMIRVDPDSLYRYATVDISNRAEALANSIENIVQVWNDLKLGWAGDTASEVQDFFDQWNHAVDRLFGTKDDAGSGALPRIADGVDLASVNYGEAEDVVIKNFASLVVGLDIGFVQGLAPHVPHSIQPPPTRNPDPTEGPITESTPAPK